MAGPPVEVSHDDVRAKRTVEKSPIRGIRIGRDGDRVSGLRDHCDDWAHRHAA